MASGQSDTEYYMKRGRSNAGHPIGPSQPGQYQHPSKPQTSRPAVYANPSNSGNHQRSKPQSSALGFDDNFVDAYNPSDIRMQYKTPHTDPLMHRDKYQDGMSWTPSLTVDHRANDLSHVHQSSYMQFTRPVNQQQMPINARHIGPSHINILLLGTAKAGKYTIAKHMAMAGDDGKFGKKYEYKGVGAVHQITFSKYNFVFIDTAGVELDQLHHEKPNANKIRKEIETFFPKGIHLILLVVRKDCWTPEELESLTYIVETLFTEKSRKNIALIHSACENLEKDRKDKYIKYFAENGGPAGKLSSLCKNMTLAVGFPNVEEASEAYRGLHEQSIKQGTEEIRNLSKSVRLENPLQISDLFREKKFSEKLQMFPTVQCIVM